MPTSVSRSIARARAAFLDSDLSCWRTVSAICTPILYTGSSEVIGSWKTIATCLPRTTDICRSLRPSNSRPRNLTEPVICAETGSSPITAIEVTDLPEPDSPTMPNTSPGRSEKLTPRTACTTPSSVGKRTLRSSTSSTAPVVAARSCSVVSVRVDMGLRSIGPARTPDGVGPRRCGCGGMTNRAVRPGGAAAGGSDRTALASAVAVRRGVERVPDPVADQVDRQHDDQDGDAGEVEQPRPGLRRLRTDRDQRTQRGLRTLDAVAEVAQRRLGDHRGGRAERAPDDDLPERVGDQVLEDDPLVRGA